VSKNNLAKGCTAVLSPLTAANELVRPCPYLTHMSHYPKQNLDRFSRFLHSSPVCPSHTYIHTDRQTHRPRYVRHL